MCYLIVCGDGFLAGSEECDDGGVSGGCDANCKIVLGYLCHTDANKQNNCVEDNSIQIIN